MTTLDSHICDWVVQSSLTPHEKARIIQSTINCNESYESIFLEATKSDRGQQWQPQSSVDFNQKEEYARLLQKYQDTNSTEKSTVKTSSAS